MELLKSALGAVLLACASVFPAQAHFQPIYTPEANLERPAEIPLLLVFWHPFGNGHAMDMASGLLRPLQGQEDRPTELYTFLMAEKFVAPPGPIGA